jgi:DNA-directed RNA polymerase subunit M/transcription elongation factor TFIIS
MKDPYYKIIELLKKKGEIGFDIKKYFDEPIISKPCVCGSNDWIYHSAQTRSADEGETSLMTCRQCLHTKKF